MPADSSDVKNEKDTEYHLKQHGFVFILDTNAFPYGFQETVDKIQPDHWQNQVAAKRQDVIMSLHEPGTIPKMMGLTDSLSFSTGKSRGIADVKI